MTTASGIRYRLVHVQNGHEHVSSVVLGVSEVSEHLHAEAVLHQATGWVTYEEPGELVVAQRPGIRREVYARAFDPFSDNPEQGGGMKKLKPCPHCGLKIIQTGDHRHPCAYCGGSLT